VVNVCHQCGVYRADKIIDPAGPAAICPECGHRHPFLYLPLLIVSGASASGKSTICNYLTGKIEVGILLDTDVLWSPSFDLPDENYHTYFETWLRLGKNINQAGRPVVLFSAGMGVPGNIEPLVERRYFSRSHYLALACADDELERRLRSRPGWRQSGSDAFIQSQLDFNRWFKEQGVNGQLPVELLDTSDGNTLQTAQDVESWIRLRLICEI